MQTIFKKCPTQKSSAFWINMLQLQISLLESVHTSPGSTVNAMRLGGRFDDWLDVVGPTLSVQRTSKPGASPYVRLGSYPIRRLLIAGSPKSRRREQVSVMFDSQ